MSRNNIEALELYTAVGMAAWLCSHSDYHRTWPLWAFEIDIQPLLELGQYKLYFLDSGTPVGFASWAWLDASARATVMREEALESEQMNSGKYLMFGDFIAPWGHAKEMVRDLIRSVVLNGEAISLGRNPDGSIRKIYRWRGARAVNNKVITSSERLGN